MTAQSRPKKKTIPFASAVLRPEKKVHTVTNYIGRYLK